MSHLLFDTEDGTLFDLDWEVLGNSHLLFDVETGLLSDSFFNAPDESPPAVPVISDVSAFQLEGTLTIDFAAPITLPVAVTAGGVTLVNVQSISPTRITTNIGSGGYGAMGTQIPIVCTDAVGSSAPALVTIAANDGHDYVTLAQAAEFNPGTAASDQIIFPLIVTHEGEEYPITMTSAGIIDYGGLPYNMPIPYRVLDASDSYRAGSWGAAYSPTDPALDPAITLAVELSVIFDNGITSVSAFLQPTIQNFSPASVTFQMQDGASWANVMTANSAPFRRYYGVDFFADGAVLVFRAVANNGSTQVVSSSQSITVRKPPVLSMVGPPATQTGAFSVQLNFSQSVTIGANAVLASGGAVVTSVTGSGTQYIANVTPPAGSVGSTTISISPSAVIENAYDIQLDPNNGVLSVAVSFDTRETSAPRLVSIGDDNIVVLGETVSLVVVDLVLANMDQLVLAGSSGEYAIPFNGSPEVTIPNYIPAGTYTAKLRRFN